VRERELILPAIAKELQAEEDLAEWIGEREVLLVLDNLEQVVSCGPELVQVLSRAPRLRLLCTSREPLRVYGESEVQVEPLPEDDGVELFRQRAVDSEPPEAVRAICARLDSLPLAIELAAARTRVLAPSALLKRLERALPLLVHRPRDSVAGGRTLRATFEWSYDLLDPGERVVFERLALFAGGCTLDEAEHVAEATLETVESLLEKAMLRRSGERYSMLHVVREFALERFRESGELDARMNLFADLVLAQDSPGAVRDDLDNWRALVDWGVARADPDRALALAGVGGRMFRPEPAEALLWGYRALEEHGARATPAARGQLLATLALIHVFRGEPSESVIAGEQAVEIFREVGDVDRLENSLAFLGATLKALGREDEAADALRRAAEVSASSGGKGNPFTLHALGELERDRGNLVEARELLEQAATAANERDARGVGGGTRHGLGDLELEEGNTGLARRYYLEALEIGRLTAFYSLVLHCVAGIATVAAAEGRFEEAADLWAAAERYSALRDMELGSNERERYLPRLAVVPAESLDEARERWKDATADAVEAAAAVD
jgi:predicted ATPase